MKTMKKVFCSIIAVLLILSMAACGSSIKSGMNKGYYETTNSYYADSMEPASAGYYESEYYDGTVSDYYDKGTSDTATGEIFNDSARKLIKTYNLSLETENFDELITALNARITSLGGYIESMQNYNGSYYGSYRGGRTANITARIPSKNAASFVEFVGNSANVVRNNLSVEDVTLTYVDTESRKATYEIEQARLLALLEKADNIEDILTIEQRLSEVRYKLEAMASQLRTYDNLVDYATVSLSIDEVKQYSEPEPESFGERVAKSFKDGLSNLVEGLKNFTVSLVGALPGLTVFAIIVAVIVLIIVRVVKKSKNKKAQKAAEYAAQRTAMAQKNTEENK